MALGCGTDPDPRPLTFEVVTFDVLKPSCGQVQCHSTTTWEQNLAFDTITASRFSMCDDGGNVVDAVTGSEKQMPPDFPLAREDEALLVNWFNAGKPGLNCPP